MVNNDTSEPKKKYFPLALAFGLPGMLFPCLPLLVSGGVACYGCIGFPLLVTSLIFSILAVRNKEPEASILLVFVLLSIIGGCGAEIFRMFVPYRPPFPPRY
jgi:hypothetical protein